MLKVLIFGAWSVAATAGSLIATMTLLSDASTGPGGSGETPPRPVFSPIIQVVAPVVQESRPTGYLFTRLTLMMDEKQRAALTVPLDYILQDSYNAFVVGNVDGAFPQDKRFDLNRFRKGLTELINTSTGGELVKEIYVSQINFVSRDSARQKQSRVIAYKQGAADDTPEEGQGSDN